MPLSADMIKTLRQKHPDAKPSNVTTMLHGPFNHVNDIIFVRINADLVRKCAIRTKTKSIEGLVAFRLISLDKSPGVRPIGVGEVLRRIIGKAILTVLKSDILNVTG